MLTASISKGAYAAKTSDFISLSRFDTEDLNVIDTITALVFTREKHGEGIRISYYYDPSYLNSYDYVYNGRQENQLHFPSWLKELISKSNKKSRVHIFINSKQLKITQNNLK